MDTPFVDAILSESFLLSGQILWSGHKIKSCIYVRRTDVEHKLYALKFCGGSRDIPAIFPKHLARKLGFPWDSRDIPDFLTPALHMEDPNPPPPLPEDYPDLCWVGAVFRKQLPPPLGWVKSRFS